jgi:hypothetical protein
MLQELTKRARYVKGSLLPSILNQANATSHFLNISSSTSALLVGCGLFIQVSPNCLSENIRLDECQTLIFCQLCYKGQQSKQRH